MGVNNGCKGYFIIEQPEHIIPPVGQQFYVDRLGRYYVDRDGNYYVTREGENN